MCNRLFLLATCHISWRHWHYYVLQTFMRPLPLPYSLPSGSFFHWLIKDKYYSIRSHPFLSKSIFFKSQVNALSEQILSFFVPKMVCLEKRLFSVFPERAERYCCWMERNVQNLRTNCFISVLQFWILSMFTVLFGFFWSLGSLIS